jgi:hypothetical protein
MKKQTYDFKIFNGRIKVYIDGYVAFTFNQIDFKGYYAYKDDTSLYVKKKSYICNAVH